MINSATYKQLRALDSRYMATFGEFRRLCKLSWELLGKKQWVLARRGSRFRLLDDEHVVAPLFMSSRRYPKVRIIHD
jgi:hypothetical protein